MELNAVCLGDFDKEAVDGLKATWSGASACGSMVPDVFACNG